MSYFIMTAEKAIKAAQESKELIYQATVNNLWAEVARAVDYAVDKGYHPRGESSRDFLTQAEAIKFADAVSGNTDAVEARNRGWIVRVMIVDSNVGSKPVVILTVEAPKGESK